MRGRALTGPFLLPSTQTAQEDVFPAGSPVPLSALRGGSRYLAWVQARNALGTAPSAPRHLDLQELGTWGQARVAPLPQPSRRSQALPVPVLGRWVPAGLRALAPPAVVPALPLAEGAETTLGSPPITTVRWRQQTQLEDVHCEERHKAEDAPMWHVRWHQPPKSPPIADPWDGAPWGPPSATPPGAPQRLQQSAFPAALSLCFKQEGKTQNISKCYLALQGQGRKKHRGYSACAHFISLRPSRRHNCTQARCSGVLFGNLLWLRTRSQRFFSFFSPNFCAPKCCRAARTSPSITPRVGTPLPAHRLRSPHGHGFSSPVCWGGRGVPVCSGGAVGSPSMQTGKALGPALP